MAVGPRNSELVEMLSADFIEKRFPIMVYGTAGGWGMREAIVGADSVELLPNDDAFDVKKVLYYDSLVASSAGGAAGVEHRSGLLKPGEVADLFYDGQNNCQLRVQANGLVDLYRGAGTATFTVILEMKWI